MKNAPHITANSVFAERINSSAHLRRGAKSKPSTGSVSGLYPVILDDGRTIIYTTDKSKEGEIRAKYALRK